MILNGNVVYDFPTVFGKAEYCEKEMATLYPEVKREEMPHQYYVDMTKKLLDLKKELLKLAKSQRVQYDIDMSLKKKL